MSPLAVRRYRAERLLRAEFRRLQARVIGTVARRLSGAGAALDRQDIEACYAAAWQGLYEAVLQGQQIVNPAGWLVLVTYRRAVDEQRARARAERRCEAAGVGAPAHAMAGAAPCAPGTDDDGLAGALDDRYLMRQLFEGLRSRLSPQEREAAVLCYLHGLNRTQAAASMGISERSVNRLMDGRGPGRPGVSAKLGALVASIREGRWCEQQASLMRGLAFGILDRSGERYRLALAHSSECPACRAYVASLRGLSAALPPALLPGGLAGAILTAAGTGAGGAAAGAGSAGQLAGGGLLGGAGAAGAAGAGGAGSGWVLLGGPLSAKLAAGCLLAIGIGAGCVGLGVQGSHQPHHRGAGRHGASTHARGHAGVRGAPARAASHGDGLPAATAAGAAAPAGASGEAARASREFGPERSAHSPTSTAPTNSSHTRARVASSSAAGPPGGPTPAASGAGRATAPASAAEREFGPG